MEDYQFGRQFEFIQGGGILGDVALTPGQEAILLVRRISGRLYEKSMYGHMLIEEIESEKCVIFLHQNVWLNDALPQIIRENSRPHPMQPNASVVRFSAVETYLVDLITKVTSYERVPGSN